jgi:hypothetical protein
MDDVCMGEADVGHEDDAGDCGGFAYDGNDDGGPPTASDDPGAGSSDPHIPEEQLVQSQPTGLSHPAPKPTSLFALLPCSPLLPVDEEVGEVDELEVVHAHAVKAAQREARGHETGGVLKPEAGQTRGASSSAVQEGLGAAEGRVTSDDMPGPFRGHEVTGATHRPEGARRRLTRPLTPASPSDDSDVSEFQPSTDGLESSCSSEDLEDGR